jgi:hypothetical protein
VWRQQYNRAQAQLNRAEQCLEEWYWMDDDKRAELETIAGLAQERLDDLEREYEYRISSSRWRP